MEKIISMTDIVRDYPNRKYTERELRDIMLLFLPRDIEVSWSSVDTSIYSIKILGYNIILEKDWEKSKWQ